MHTKFLFISFIISTLGPLCIGHFFRGTSRTLVKGKLASVLLEKCVLMIPERFNLEKSHSLFSTYADDPFFAVEYDEQLLKELNSTSTVVLDQKSGPRISFENLPIFVIEKRVVDRSCLILPPGTPIKMTYHTFLNFDNDFYNSHFIDFVNSHCFLFRTFDGNVDRGGIHRRYILDNFYRPSTPQHCEEVQSIPESSEAFFRTYVQYSKPVIFRNATANWPAMTKWSNDFFRSRSSSKKIHIKLAPFGEFEGVDDINNWEDYRSGRFRIPPEVLKQLSYPDLVVVRPASAEMTLSDFIDYLENRTSTLHNATVYLEYASLHGVLPDLLNDIIEPSFAASLFTKRHTNIWFSDGNTVGKLHFDPFDNLLSQISGSKEVTMYAPFDSSLLYEGHITEAILSFDFKDMKFRRETLLTSTALVMSPVDITKPNLTRFPKFRQAIPLTCKINAGDILYMPAFWWHEVKSSPSELQKRNLAVNFWYEPFLKKEMPCATCAMDVNPHYLHLL